jgi:hypothetical protein
MRARPILVTIMLLFFVSCSTVKPASDPEVIYGMVYDLDNKQVQGVEVYVDKVLTAVSNINGRFSIPKRAFGKYDFVFKKEGYEVLTITLEYTDPTQIIYVKLSSADQLLVKAELAVETRRWDEAEQLIDRVLAVNPKTAPASYLKAVVKYRTGNNEAARGILESLIASDYREPSIRLFLADIYQYKLNDPAAAKSQLSEYLKLRTDPEMEKRRNAIADQPKQ